VKVDILEVHDTVKRREEVKNFVVADDGLGYAGVGEEEDWNVDQYNGDGNSLPLDAEGRLPFFLIDAHEEPYEANPGTIYMFGKVCVHA
jgi:DNA polymerase alpha subunit A